MTAADIKRREALALLDAQAWVRARTALTEIIRSGGAEAEKDASLWFGLSRALDALGQHREGEQALAKAYQAAPEDQTIALAAAKHLVSVGDPAQAAKVLVRARRAHPSDAGMAGLLADCYELCAQNELAIEACHTLARLTPHDPVPLLKAARIHVRISDFEAAEEDLRSALARDPTNLSATNLLADILRMRGRVEDERAVLLARASLGGDRAAAAAARFKAAFAQPVILRSEEEADAARQRYAAALAAGPEVLIEDPFRAGLAPNFFLNYQARDDRALQEAYAAYCLAAAPSLAVTAPHVGRAARGRRIRLGLFSSFFANQTVGFLTYGLVRDLDRARFDIVLFRPAHSMKDAETERFRALARMVEVPSDLGAARAAIAAEELDILHFPEIGMDPFTYLLAYARLATLQTMAWGHPVTTGLSTIDHFISVDDMEPPGGERHYREHLVRMKGLTFSAEHPPHASAAREKLGLGPGAAYVCLQSLCKIHPRFDAILAKILAKDPRGTLYFLSNGAHMDGLLLERLASTFEGVASRTKFLPKLSREGFLALAGAADVALDVPEWSGGRTSLETFAAGTPVVHMPGAFMRGRHTLAFYRRMGITVPVTSSAVEYAEMAVRLVHDAKLRGEVRAQIADAWPRLYDDHASIQEFEEMWPARLAART